MTPTQFAFSSAFIMGTTGLTFHRTHLLSALLCLEGMMLSLLIALALWSLELDSAGPMASPMILLAFSACEAGAGLALLIATSRTHGGDQMKNLNLLQC
uniref:NADH-ubiquinone oxidoreductase chain 4L n=1 Tax=Eurypegasus draconis TaxID=215339 RepID=A7E1D5_9TELE|nr:NADH dehydrogenase subunit 4L [Eurypegasus draconis]BAF74946.1 NADH dehydrogenase subunit 4L [Eurypegasus draconis]